MTSAEPTTPRRRRRLPRAARPFLHGQYRILALALIMSLLGGGVWLVSMVFEIKDTLGGGPIAVSYVATANAVGLIVATLIGGAIADRVPQKWILVAIESVKALGAGTTAVLAITGNIELWHLIVVAVVLGLADGFFYPAYSALLPSILPADDLLAANGLEGMLRPTLVQAIGPGIAGLIIAIASPAWGFAVVTIAQVFAVAGLVWLKTTPVRRELDDSERARHPITGMLIDIKDGVVYMVRTPWLFGTLLYASILVFVIIGPIEVLLPFVAADQANGGPGGYALVLAAFGFGGAIASLVVASMKLPRRYLTVMTLSWGLFALPLAIVGYLTQLWLIAIAVFIVGAGFSVGQVIWGTLLQRRVPHAMLGRVSSLDFFVSLVFMPISMAVAGPLGELVGFGPVFVVAGTVPVVLAVITIVAARMPRDEIENPLDPPADVSVDAEPLLET
jgi:MFS family permease